MTIRKLSLVTIRKLSLVTVRKLSLATIHVGTCDAHAHSMDRTTVVLAQFRHFRSCVTSPSAETLTEQRSAIFQLAQLFATLRVEKGRIASIVRSICFATNLTSTAIQCLIWEVEAIYGAEIARVTLQTIIKENIGNPISVPRAITACFQVAQRSGSEELIDELLKTKDEYNISSPEPPHEALLHNIRQKMPLNMYTSALVCLLPNRDVIESALTLIDMRRGRRYADFKATAKKWRNRDADVVQGRKEGKWR